MNPRIEKKSTNHLTILNEFKGRDNLIIEINSEVDKALKKIKSNPSNAESKEFFSMSDLIVLICCRCFAGKENMRKNDKFRSFLTYGSKYSDALNIIKAIHEIEKLKQVIFDEKQAILFAFLSKAKNPLDNDPELKKTLTKEKNISEKVKEHLNELKLKKNLSYLDKKLVELLAE